MSQSDKGTTTFFRAQDNSIEIHTNAYVSHRKGRGAWKSSFSVNFSEAERLRDEITALLNKHGPQGAEPSEACDPTNPLDRMYENEIIK